VIIRPSTLLVVLLLPAAGTALAAAALAPSRQHEAARGRARQQVRTGPPSSAYALAWADEFDGDALDTTKWDHRGLGKRRDAINVPEAVRLDGQGHLVITTTRAGDEFRTGMIGTEGKYQARYGYFECRFEVQSQPGHWSAFWLQSPTYGVPLDDVRRAGAEIDAFEYLASRGDRLQHALHWDGYAKEHKSAVHIADVPGLRDGWHTVGFLWNALEYVFSVDGRETWRTREGVSQRAEFLILSLEVGPWAGDIRQAALPDSLLVDYVRVYQRRDVPE
jgi:beta-glucanase (GH16 family)